MFGNHRVEFDLVQEIAKLLDEFVVAVGVSVTQGVDRIDHFVGLLEQVRDERTVGLFFVPWALLTQCACELVEANKVMACRRCKAGYPETRQVVGIDCTVDL